MKTNLRESASPFTLNVDDRISFRLYRDTRPHCLEIAPLQKGLALVLDGKELIEEGVGFGLPVVKYGDKTYFSSVAQTWLQADSDPPTLVKTFCFDTISRKRLGENSYINDRFYAFIHRSFEKAYLAHNEMAPAFNTIMELRKTMKIQTDFVRAPSRGKVKVAYTCCPDLLKVRVDFSELRKDGCQEILVLNEQGSTFFTKYSDSDGLLLVCGRMGAWRKVSAARASLSDRRDTFSFTLQNAPSAGLFRGWERTRGRFSWAGLGYSLPKTISGFNYNISLNMSSQRIGENQDLLKAVRSVESNAKYQSKNP